MTDETKPEVLLNHEQLKVAATDTKETSSILFNNASILIIMRKGPERNTGPEQATSDAGTPLLNKNSLAGSLSGASSVVSADDNFVEYVNFHSTNQTDPYFLNVSLSCFTR